MEALRFNVDVEGLQRFEAAVKGVAGFIDKPVPLVRENVKKWFFALEFNQFLSEGSKGRSGKWAPLAPSMIKSKERDNPIWAPLERTGALKRALSRPGAANQIDEATGTEMTLGTDLPYAGLHQRGTSRMPARPPIDPSEEAYKELAKELRRPFQALVREQGFEVLERE